MHHKHSGNRDKRAGSSGILQAGLCPETDLLFWTCWLKDPLDGLEKLMGAMLDAVRLSSTDEEHRCLRAAFAFAVAAARGGLLAKVQEGDYCFTPLTPQQSAELKRLAITLRQFTQLRHRRRETEDVVDVISEHETKTPHIHKE